MSELTVAVNNLTEELKRHRRQDAITADEAVRQYIEKYAPELKEKIYVREAIEYYLKRNRREQ